MKIPNVIQKTKTNKRQYKNVQGKIVKLLT